MPVKHSTLVREPIHHTYQTRRIHYIRIILCSVNSFDAQRETLAFMGTFFALKRIL